MHTLLSEYIYVLKKYANAHNTTRSVTRIYLSAAQCEQFLKAMFFFFPQSVRGWELPVQAGGTEFSYPAPTRKPNTAVRISNPAPGNRGPQGGGLSGQAVWLTGGLQIGERRSQG